MDSTRKQTLLYEKFGWTYPETLYWGFVSKSTSLVDSVHLK